MKKILLIILMVFCSTKNHAQAGDCPALCVISDIVGTTAVDGTTNELGSFATCLAAGEATSSYWYQVCFSSNGTFSFLLDPSGDRNDFDFAIWSGTNCPPTANSIRCSFAAVSPGGPCATCDDTGLGNGSAETSETASGDGWLAPINVSNGQCITMCINNYGSGSDVFDLDFTGTATMTCVGTLPIVLLKHDVVKNNNKVDITWTTATERNNDYFSIEKSIDGVNYDKIRTIKGNGNSSTSISYKASDFLTKEGVYYYKVSQTDYDGTSKNLFIESVSYSTEETIEAIYNAQGYYLGRNINEVEKNVIIIIQHKNGTYTKTIKF